MSSAKRPEPRRNMTQSDVAKLIKSSQSRVAKMEAGDSSASLDLLVRSLIALGASSRGVLKLISTKKSASAA
jgi:transcriptional regulator with XRE-family HTH domain